MYEMKEKVFTCSLASPTKSRVSVCTCTSLCEWTLGLECVHAVLCTGTYNGVVFGGVNLRSKLLISLRSNFCGFIFRGDSIAS